MTDGKSLLQINIRQNKIKRERDFRYINKDNKKGQTIIVESDPFLTLLIKKYKTSQFLI